MSQPMKVRHHALSEQEFTALARGEGGAAAIRRLVAAQRSKHVILVRGVAELARRGDRPADKIAQAGYDLLARVQRHDQPAVDAVVGYPSVGAWALHTLRGDSALPGAQVSGLAGIAAAAAIRAGLDAEIEVPVTDGTVLLPSLGMADAAGATSIVRTRTREILSGGSRVEMRAGAPGWHGLRTVEAERHCVVIDDVDPFRMPASDGAPTTRLTPAQLSDFAASLREGWEMLPPGSAAEIAAIVKVIVPYQAPEAGRVSTTSPQVFGTVAMSLQPDKYSCAETLVHETQHLKLCALLDLVMLTVPDDGQRFYAPWRTDPRPASGLLQGAYAFLGVSGFWREHCRTAPELAVRHRAHAEFARWRDGAALVTDTLLTSGQLTDPGQAFAREMAQVLEAWAGEPVPAEALRAARHEAARHLTRWHADNG